MNKRQIGDIIEYTPEKEKLLLRYLISSTSSFVRCQNILKPDYWDDKLRRPARYILNFVQHYNKLPTPDQIQAECGISIPLIEDADAQEEWFLYEIEEFCRNKAMRIMVLEGIDLVEKGRYAELERRVKENMLISLQKELGTDYFSDPLVRLQRMKDRTGMRSTGWRDIDEKLYGGFNRGEITIFLGAPGCVTFDTRVRVIRLQKLKSKGKKLLIISDYLFPEKFTYLLTFYTPEQIEECVKGNNDKLDELWTQHQPFDEQIGNLKDAASGVKYLVDSPDGWVPVIAFVKKPVKLIYFVTMGNGTTIKASGDHLFQRKNLSWVESQDLVPGDLLITSKGLDFVRSAKKLKFEEVFDLSVDHENHRYYTNGISSHNTGKSLFLQNLALNWVQQGLNIVYITLELSEDLIGLRYDAMITTLPTKQIFKYSEDAALKWQMIVKANSWGKLQIKSMPGAGTCANNIKAYIKEYEIQTGAKVDGLIVDYLDLIYPSMSSLDMSDLFVKDKFTSEELRALAGELEILCATAGQLNRKGIQEQNFDASHTAGGISKFNTADNVMAIFTSPSLKERGEYQIQFLKTRSSSGVGSKVSLAYNIENMRITDFDGVSSGPSDISHAAIIQKQLAGKKPARSSSHDTRTQLHDIAARLRD